LRTRSQYSFSFSFSFFYFIWPRHPSRDVGITTWVETDTSTTLCQLSLGASFKRTAFRPVAVTAERWPPSTVLLPNAVVWFLRRASSRVLCRTSRPTMSLFDVKRRCVDGVVLSQCHAPTPRSTARLISLCQPPLASFHYVFHLRMVKGCALRCFSRTTSLYIHNAYSYPSPSTSSRSYIWMHSREEKYIPEQPTQLPQQLRQLL
jgi:hypothetical protein